MLKHASLSDFFPADSERKHKLLNAHKASPQAFAVCRGVDEFSFLFVPHNFALETRTLNQLLIKVFESSYFWKLSIREKAPRKSFHKSRGAFAETNRLGRSYEARLTSRQARQSCCLPFSLTKHADENRCALDARREYEWVIRYKIYSKTLIVRNYIKKFSIILAMEKVLCFFLRHVEGRWKMGSRHD